ncbi:MAG: S8 family serine peptidase [Nanoarchaeota archaeon]|nr:S8 family serine peptidase [Nanoarchaeota archaeon]
MKKNYLVMLGVFSVVVFLLIPNFAIAGRVKDDLSKKVSQSNQNDEISVLIQFNKKAVSSEIDDLKTNGANIKHQFKTVEAASAKIKAKDINKLASKSFVKLIEPDYEVKLVMDKSAPQIQADKVWAMNITGKNANVAVVDTGIDNENIYLHVIKEADFTGEGTDDLHGHGTHVSGTIASTQTTYKGIAYGANLMDAKALDQYGSGYSSNVINAIDWAVLNGADVISMSLGAAISPCDGSDTLSWAVDNAVSNGVVVVVAAGNSGPGNNTINSPGCAKSALTVGAVNDYDAIASFSSRGPTSDGRIKPDLVAPGVAIISTWKDGVFVSASGTSMATPHVSGAVALLLEKDASLSPAAVKSILKANALDLGLDPNTQGAGRVDIYKAVNSLIKNPNISITNFSSDRYVAQPGQLFKVTVYAKNFGNADATGVKTTLELPPGWVSQTNLTQNIPQSGILNPSSQSSATWTIGTSKNGTYAINVIVSSENDGQDFKSLTLVVQQPIINKTPSNQTNNQTRNNTKPPQKNNTKVPPGLQKKNIPKGLEDKAEAGATTGNTAYALKRWYERTSLFFTFNTEKKAEKQLKYAEQKATEAQISIDKGDEAQARELLKESDKNILAARQIANDMNEKGKETKSIEGKIKQETTNKLAVKEYIEEKVQSKTAELPAETENIPAQPLVVDKTEKLPQKSAEQEKQTLEPLKKPTTEPPKKTTQEIKKQETQEPETSASKSSTTDLSESNNAQTVAESNSATTSATSPNTETSAASQASTSATTPVSSSTSSSAAETSGNSNSALSSADSTSSSSSTSSSASATSSSSSSSGNSGSSSGNSASSSSGSSSPGNSASSSGSGNSGGNSGNSRGRGITGSFLYIVRIINNI